MGVVEVRAVRREEVVEAPLTGKVEEIRGVGRGHALGVWIGGLFSPTRRPAGRIQGPGSEWIDQGERMEGGCGGYG